MWFQLRLYSWAPYDLNRGRIIRLEDKQKDLEQKVDLASLKIWTLEDNSKHHEEEIAKLLVSNS